MVNLQFFRDNWRNNFLRTVTTPSAQLLTEKGDAFVASYRVEDLADDSTTVFAVRTASDEATVVSFDMNVEGRVRVDFYEDGSVSDTTDMFDENLNRSSFSDASSDVEPLADVTVDTQGTKISEGGAGGQRSGANVSRPVPANVLGSAWVLNPDTTYIYEVENVSGDTVDLNVSLGYTTRDLPEP